jgi:hypothetical protein
MGERSPKPFVAAKIAVPQPPKTDQNVPSASAASRWTIVYVGGSIR